MTPSAGLGVTMPSFALVANSSGVRIPLLATDTGPGRVTAAAFSLATFSSRFSANLLMVVALLLSIVATASSEALAAASSAFLNLSISSAAGFLVTTSPAIFLLLNRF